MIWFLSSVVFMALLFSIHWAVSKRLEDESTDSHSDYQPNVKGGETEK